MKQLFFAFLVLLAITSCRKKTTVTIQAQDYITGSGAAYAGKEYAVSESWTPILETKSKIVASGFLDQNGHASFNLKMKGNRKYVLGVSQPDNICYGGLKQYYLESQKSNVVNFTYAHCAYLKFILNNVNCFNSNDAITYTRIWLTDNDINGSNTYTGCAYYEGNFFELPEGNYRYDWVVTKNGTSTSFSQNFTLTNSDSTTFQINY